MPFDDGFEKPRSERTPADYVNQITNSVCDSLIQLGRVKDETDFDVNFFQPTMETFKRGVTADTLWAAMDDPRRLDAALRANPKAAAQIPRDATLHLPSFHAALALLFCVQAMNAERAGDLSTAWTYAIDARFAADAVLSRITDHVTITLHKRGMAKLGATTRLKHSPKQAAKGEALKLWTERHEGKHPKLRTNEQFAAECMRRWPVLTSAKVILGWCTDWNKAAKAGDSQPAS